MGNTYKLIDYFDVWFNEEEGYTVNDQCPVLEGITLTEDATNEDIFKYLKDIVGFFGPEAEFDKLSFDGDDFFIEISSEVDGYTLPLCRLERER